MKAIEVANLTRNFNGLCAVNDISSISFDFLANDGPLNHPSGVGN